MWKEKAEKDLCKEEDFPNSNDASLHISMPPEGGSTRQVIGTQPRHRRAGLRITRVQRLGCHHTECAARQTREATGTTRGTSIVYHKTGPEKAQP